MDDEACDPGLGLSQARRRTRGCRITGQVPLAPPAVKRRILLARTFEPVVVDHEPAFRRQNAMRFCEESRTIKPVKRESGSHNVERLRTRWQHLRRGRGIT